MRPVAAVSKRRAKGDAHPQSAGTAGGKGRNEEEDSKAVAR